MRTQLCVVVAGLGPSIDREAAWSEAAEDFLRRMHKLGVQITIVGPRPPRKFGSKRSIRFMDRHEVIGLKVLAASRSHRLEFRVLNSKTRTWTRLRAEACVTIGPYGVWPRHYEGWTHPGTLSINALTRWLTEYKWVPGREFAFVGSSNQALRWASTLLDRGAKSVYVVEEGEDFRCWRAHLERFTAKGGRVLLRHRILKVSSANNMTLYLDNTQGTMILPVDTIVHCSSNDDALNEPDEWKDGLFYIQRRKLPWEPFCDEEQWFETLDWRELYWRLVKMFDLVDYSEADGALKAIRADRKNLIAYRKMPALPPSEAPMRNSGQSEKRTLRALGYSGKILDRATLATIQSSDSVPKSFAHAKPVASLECFENVPCRACADACPENAIEITKITDLPKLVESKCTGCGACVAACPVGAAVMVRDLPTAQKARYFLPDDTRELWREGRALQLLNRKGDVLGSARIVSSMSYEGGLHRILEVESTNVHVWEARGFRDSKTSFAEDIQASAQSPILLKRGWVKINGVRRLCPIDVPITVALWQLGQRRFEDTLFCHDGGCRLCEVTIDGRPALACRTLARDGQDIAFQPKLNAKDLKQPLCPCKQLTPEEFQTALSEGATKHLAQELTGYGQGTCHGRLCRSFANSNGEQEAAKQRPCFHGYESSPWRDIWADDVVEDDSERLEDFDLDT
jgi:ferredoxin